MIYVLVYGSIHIDVPVYPVCPNDPTGSSDPRFDENDESMSQPSPRTSVAFGGCCGVVIFSIMSPSRIDLRLISACAYIARSPAVENTPACPATPPILSARGSCTTPRRICFLSGAKVSAILFFHSGGGRKRVCFMPRGWKTCTDAYWSNAMPESLCTSSPSTMKLVSLYMTTEPCAACSFSSCPNRTPLSPPTHA